MQGPRVDVVELKMYVIAADVLLKFLNRWNMNARHSRVAQTGGPYT